MTMSEISKPVDALPVVAKIQNIETEVLSCEIQNINVPLAPEVTSGQYAEQSTRKQIPIFGRSLKSPSRSFTKFGLGQC